VDIDPECQFPFLVGNILDGLEARLMRGVVDEDIDAAEFFAGGLDDLAAMGGGLDIAGQKHGLAPVLDEALRLLGIVVLFEIADQDIGATRTAWQSRPAPAAMARPAKMLRQMEAVFCPRC
jgi:hypothetical protein